MSVFLKWMSGSSESRAYENIENNENQSLISNIESEFRPYQGSKNKKRRIVFLTIILAVLICSIIGIIKCAGKSVSISHIPRQKEKEIDINR